MTAMTSTERLGISILRVQLGAALQKQRLQRGLTQAQLAEFADLSLKYVGEIERGEANTTLEVLERLAAAVAWDPMEALEGLREPLSEGVRMLLLDEVQQILDRLRNMTKWLHALDPALQAKAPRPGAAQPSARPRPQRRTPRTVADPADARKEHFPSQETNYEPVQGNVQRPDERHAEPARSQREDLSR